MKRSRQWSLTEPFVFRSYLAGANSPNDSCFVSKWFCRSIHVCVTYKVGSRFTHAVIYGFLIIIDFSWDFCINFRLIFSVKCTAYSRYVSIVRRIVSHAKQMEISILYNFVFGVFVILLHYVATTEDTLVPINPVRHLETHSPSHRIRVQLLTYLLTYLLT